MKKIFQRIVIVVLCFSLSGCGTLMGNSKKDPRENLFAKEDPHFNTTRASQVLACVGDIIQRSDEPPIDLIVSGVRDQTKPIEVPGLLATDNTMMATVAVDRLNTPKISVIGSSGAMPGRATYQLVGAFTELNRTYNSTALGGSARIGNIELDLGGDNEWNHIALDLGLTSQGRLVNGMTVSVSISLQNNNRDGNMSVSPGSSNSGTIAIGFRTKEGIHAAQRLLVETATAVLIAKLYNVDASQCFKKVYQEQANFDDVSIPQYYNDGGANAFKSKVQADTVAAQGGGAEPKADAEKSIIQENSDARTDGTAPIGSNCQVILGSLATPQDLRYEWNGACDASNLAEGEGLLRIYAGKQLKYAYKGSMQAGQMHGTGALDYKDLKRTYKGAFERGNPTGDGIIETPHGRYKAQYSSETRTLTNGAMIK